jgi:hypothetical protein
MKMLSRRPTKAINPECNTWRDKEMWKINWAWWYTSVIPATGRHRLEHSGFKRHTQEDSGLRTVVGKNVKSYPKNN